MNERNKVNDEHSDQEDHNERESSGEQPAAGDIKIRHGSDQHDIHARMGHQRQGA